MKILPATLAIMFNIAWPASLAESGDSTANQRINLHYDWVIFVDLHEVKDYMHYEKCALYPVEVAQIDYRVTPRGLRVKEEDAPEQTFYEDVFYHNGKSVGLKRYNDLVIPANKNGVIIINSDKLDVPAGQAIADVLARLTLDTTKGHLITSSIQLPGDVYDKVASGLRNFNFVPLMSSMGGKQLCIPLNDSEGEAEYYYYQKPAED